MKSRLWRAVISTGMAGMTMSLLVGVGSAAAHPNDPHESDEQHAAQDLAGVPMEQIEKDTRANALKIKKVTGASPGGRTANQRVANEQASSQVTDDPGQGGRWSAVVNTPVVPVFQAVLPNGKVLLWDSVGDQSAESYPNHTFTRAAVWDPSTNTSKQVNVAGYNIFCAGYVQLADGRVLVAGGNKSQALDGIVQTHTVRLAHRDLVARAGHERCPLVSLSGGAGQRGGADRRRWPRDRRGLPERQHAAPVDRLHQLRRPDLPLPRAPARRSGRAGRSVQPDGDHDHDRRGRSHGDP